MNRKKINLYIANRIKGKAIRNYGAYLYVLEWVKAGVPYTRSRAGHMLDVNEDKLALTALLCALKRMREPDEIRIFTDCTHIIHAIQNHWYKQWEKVGWKNAKGKPVKESALWEGIAQALESHIITLTDEKHSYSAWMERTCRLLSKEGQGREKEA
uniref:RNase H family protein n=1 Tax=Eisenbergiella sp. TaxID=1924109 RepID=UPI003AB5403F